MFYRLRLPEGVDNRTALLTHNIIIPKPSLRVYGLTDRTQNTQTGQVKPERDTFKLPKITSFLHYCVEKQYLYNTHLMIKTIYKYFK